MKERKFKFDNDLEINFPAGAKTAANGNKFNVETPIISVWDKKFFLREVGEHVGALKATAQAIKAEDDSVKVVGDLMAGTGLGSMVLAKYLQPQRFYINDFSVDCVNVLMYNFQGVTITCEDANTISWKDDFDLITIDFNTFSLKHYPKWEKMLERVADMTRWLLITDTACFGFKFEKNFISYGVDNPKSYYEKMASMFPSKNHKLRMVAQMRNSAVVTLSTCEGDWKFLKSLPILITESLGLGLL